MIHLLAALGAPTSSHSTLVPTGSAARITCNPNDAGACMYRGDDGVLTPVGPSTYTQPKWLDSGIKSIYNTSAYMKGVLTPLSNFVAPATLVTNVASAWGLANLNYEGLRLLLGNYSAHGLQVLAFPSNEFGGQAPCSSPCERAYMYHKMGDGYDGAFPIFDKASITGAHTITTFSVLKHDVPAPGSSDTPPGHEVSWNYEKWLVGPDGVPLKRYASEADPRVAEPDIRKLLGLD